MWKSKRSLDLTRVSLIGRHLRIDTSGHKDMSSILADQYLHPSYSIWAQMRGGGGRVAGSQPMSTAVHMEPK